MYVGLLCTAPRPKRMGNGRIYEILNEPAKKANFLQEKTSPIISIKFPTVLGPYTVISG